MDIFSALAEPTRRNIIELLAEKGELSSSDIFAKFAVTHAAISQHLKVLREANLVQVEKRAQQRVYTINHQKVAELEQWAKQLTKTWNNRFDLLEKVLEREKNKLKKSNS